MKTNCYSGREKINYGSKASNYLCCSPSPLSAGRLSYFLSHEDIHSSGFGGKCISDEGKPEERNKEIPHIDILAVTEIWLKKRVRRWQILVPLKRKNGTYLTA